MPRRKRRTLYYILDDREGEWLYLSFSEELSYRFGGEVFFVDNKRQAYSTHSRLGAMEVRDLYVPGAHVISSRNRIVG